MKYFFYLATGKTDEPGYKDRLSEPSTLDDAFAAFKKAIEDGHEYGCLEFLSEKPPTTDPEDSEA